MCFPKRLRECGAAGAAKRSMLLSALGVPAFDFNGAAGSAYFVRMAIGGVKTRGRKSCG